MSSKPKKHPKLKPESRFPEFQNAEGWTETELKRIAHPVSERATGSRQETVLTLSGENGLVHQDEYFGKKIAGDNTERYIKIIRNDFVYNDRTTKASTYGTIKRLSKYPDGLVSPIYKCFRFIKDECPSFWEFYFESGVHESQLHSLINEGARAGRFNISVDKFLSAIAWRPNPEEQQKIADCLSSLDELIEAEDAKLEALQLHKKGMMRELFPAEGEALPNHRFPEFQNDPEWEERSLESVATYENGKAYEPHILEAGRYIVVNSRFISTNGRVIKYSNEDLCIANYGDVLIVLSDLPNGTALAKAFLVDSNDTYAVNQRICRLAPYDIHNEFFYYLINRHPKLLAYDDGQNQTHLKKDSVMQCPLMVPKQQKEQQMVADCLTYADKIINTQRQKIVALRDHKKGLMQQLFPTPSHESEG